jgi:hypothetical protein
MKTSHITLSAAMITVENLVAQGHTSFKVWREESVWHVSLSNVEVNSKGVSDEY